MLKVHIAAASLVLASIFGAGAEAAQVLRPMRVLITNDDGIDAAGIAELVEAFRPIATVVVAAPAENSSAASQSVTLYRKPLRVVERKPESGVKRFAVHGAPADCVVFGLLGPGKQVPFDLVVSGINHGNNVGDAVFVSGTVGAARQAVLMGVPAIAISQAEGANGRFDFALAANITARLASELHRLHRTTPMLISVNVPAAPRGVKLVRVAGKSLRMEGIRVSGDSGSAGDTSYVADFARSRGGDPETDVGAINAGYVTVSLLGTDPNARAPDAERALRALLPRLEPR